ncbi:VWA domain-containing protein [Candidatus Nanohaloarchaea archaeon]|nr:VWA domain-containing protein [Candidatus Nanohaloarchaea archaeon]
MIGFEQPLALVLVALSITGLYTIYTASDKYPKILGATRFAVILLLALAVAGPQIQMSQQRMENPHLNLLKDNSRSTQFMKQENIQFSDIQTETEIIASGNSSEIKNNILRNLEPNKAYLVMSDLQTNEDLTQVVKEAQKKNATVSFIKPEMQEEHAVTIRGPSRTVPGANNRFTVKVSSTAESPVSVEVMVDGETVKEGEISGNWSFTRQFESKGYHKIKAVLKANDRENANNAYYKTVEVTEKPKILVIGESSPLQSDLQQYFKLEHVSEVPEDLSSYDAVFAKQEFNEKELIPYITKGKGLVYTGEYNMPYSILPVRKVPGADNENKGARIILAVDTSYSLFSDREQTAETVAGSFVKILGRNNPSSKVAILNYGLGNEGYDPRIVRNPGQPAFLGLTYQNDRQRLMSRIASLEGTAGAIQSYGLRGAKELAQRKEGETAIVMITDGKFEDITKATNSNIKITAEQDKAKMKEVAESLDSSKHPLYFVTIGDAADTSFLSELTSRTHIRSFEYLKSGGRFSIMAGGGNSGVGTVQSINNQHFITEGLNTNSRVTGTDSVKVRPSGNLLLATQDGDPVLTTWRYGLGRVAAFSADNKNLAGLMREDPSAVIRTFSWAVGDVSREGRWVSVSSARRGESRPEVEASYSIEGLTRDAGGTYSDRLDPEGLGFHSFHGVPYSYNYNPELQEVGYDSRIDSIARKTGGEVYSVGKKDKIVSDLRSFSSEKVVRKTSLTPYLLVLALVVFLGEVGFRKFKGRR